MMFRNHNPNTLHVFGEYEADSAKEALDVMAQEMGYDDYATAAEAGIVAIADEIAE